jgi:hypothetical protein
MLHMKALKRNKSPNAAHKQVLFLNFIQQCTQLLLNINHPHGQHSSANVQVGSWVRHGRIVRLADRTTSPLLSSRCRLASSDL